MLVVDASVTLITWLPHNLFISLKLSYPALFELYIWSQIAVTQDTLIAIVFTNSISTPLIYLIFNKAFRVSMQYGVLTAIENIKTAT
jgi:hypothetical protein